MTPKEKAKEIVYKYENLVTIWDCYNDAPLDVYYKLPDMKRCALICVDEILSNFDTDYNTKNPTVVFYKKVIEEILKIQL